MCPKSDQGFPSRAIWENQANHCNYLVCSSADSSALKILFLSNGCLREEKYLLHFLCTLVSYEGLGMYTEHIPDERITASSWFSSKHLPYYGRLDTNIGHGAWCAAANDKNPYLEIDLEMEYSISGIIIQGKYRLSSDQLADAWVTVFSLSFAVTREQWTYVIDVNTKQPIVSISSLLWVQILFLQQLHLWL